MSIKSIESSWLMGRIMSREYKDMPYGGRGGAGYCSNLLTRVIGTIVANDFGKFNRFDILYSMEKSERPGGGSPEKSINSVLSEKSKIGEFFIAHGYGIYSLKDNWQDDC